MPPWCAHSDQCGEEEEEEGVRTALLAKISQDERLHLTADQEEGTDESPTSTRNGAKLLVGVGEDLRLRKGVTRARQGGGTTSGGCCPS